MAVTRGATGNSRPRIIATIDTATATKPRKSTKANTSKPRTPATKTGRVAKAPSTHHKRKPNVKDKVEGAIEKAVGKVERKPGKEGAGTKKMKGTDGKGGKKTTTAAATTTKKI